MNIPTPLLVIMLALNCLTIAQAFIFLMWMKTMSSWQKRQGQEILRIYDYIKDLYMREGSEEN